MCDSLAHTSASPRTRGCSPSHTRVHFSCKHDVALNLYCMFNCSYIYFIETFILQNCTVISPSTGAIIVSCDSPHQILVITHTNNCFIKVSVNGSSPLTVRGLDPGMMYSVIINVFDGNQVVLRSQIVTKTILVKGYKLGKTNNCLVILTYINNNTVYTKSF